jgi:hypothetical protein
MDKIKTVKEIIKKYGTRRQDGTLINFTESDLSLAIEEYHAQFSPTEAEVEKLANRFALEDYNSHKGGSYAMAAFYRGFNKAASLGLSLSHQDKREPETRKFTYPKDRNKNDFIDPETDCTCSDDGICKVCMSENTGLTDNTM